MARPGETLGKDPEPVDLPTQPAAAVPPEVAVPPGAPQPLPPRLRKPLFYPDWRCILLVATLLAVALLFVPALRSWAYVTLVLPVVADVLGRRRLVVDGIEVTAPYPFAVELAIIALLILALLTLRAVLLMKRSRGSIWARRVRIDSGMVLALIPFLALGPVVSALESGLLFRVPWAFLAVPPLLYVLTIALAVVSLLFGLWIEEGGPRHAYPRFLVALLLFLSVDLFWISVVGGTTRPLPLWAPPLAVLAAFGTFFGVTLGNRLLTHRRVLFALGAFHVALFSTFLASLVVDGPWPAHDWTFQGHDAVRTLGAYDPFHLVLVFLVPVAFLVGFATLGEFLHRYAFWARPWVDGLNLAVVFAVTLEAWTTTLLIVDPYDALHATRPPLDAFEVWATGLLHGWGLFAIKVGVAVLAVLLLDLPLRRPVGLAAEASHLARGALVALGLIPGLRDAIRIGTGL